MKSLRLERPEYIYVGVSILPAAWMKHRGAIDEIVARHPILFGEHKKGDHDYDEVGGTYLAGEHTVYLSVFSDELGVDIAKGLPIL